MRESSPAEVMVELLVLGHIAARSEVQQLSFEGKIQAFSNSLPNEAPKAIGVYDMAGMIAGRAMNTGRTLEHHGVRIILRYPDSTGRALMMRMTTFFDKLLPSTVRLNGLTYYIHTVYRTSAPVPLGEEEGTRRQKWTLDVFLVYRDQETSDPEECPC